MKVAGKLFCTSRKLFSFLLIVLFSAIQGFANNPDVSNYLKNLSSSINSGAYDDLMPEMIISGNTIHVLWIEYASSSENNIYYCRSTDLGDHWETPQKIASLKDGVYARYPISRKLAVDGNTVHIAFCDYDYADKGTGRVFYLRSKDGGSTFESVSELVSTGQGYKKITGTQIKVVSGKVAIAYVGSGAVPGLRVLSSTNSGDSFTDKAITTDSENLTDFWYDGNQMIILSDNQWYSYGLSKGLVYVSVSNDNGLTFTTQKISQSYNSSETSISEKCTAVQYQHYVPKIAKSGNNIHVIFTGNIDKDTWTVMYVRSTDNGQTFEPVKDVNNGVLSGSYMGSGQETIVAKNGHVYVVYIRSSINNNNQPIYFTQSADNGSSFSVATNILPEGYSYLDKTWWPGLLIDPADPSGKTVYFYGSSMYSAKSTDGGESFGENLESTPFLGSLIVNKAYTKSDLLIDANGEKHWISQTEWRYGTDADIMYKHIGKQPAPGNVNKALYLQTTYSPQKMETVVVPASPSLDFDSAMTAEAWVKFDQSTDEITNIMAKVNGYDGYDSAPEAYQMSFKYNKGNMAFTAGVETDKGDFVNTGLYTIGDTLWHHVAFTYDASAGLNNFKTYVDGLLSVQKTVTGKIKPGNGLLMIGTRGAFIRDAKYQIDNLRLWNRALSQTELLDNQKENLSGKEDGLKLFLNFDDTFKDISGNGNDGVPLYLGELRTSDFYPPVSEFDLYKSANQISLTNKTKNGTDFNWSFGDGKSSVQGNPVYTYPTPGEYTVTLESVNANSKTSAVKSVSIAGLDRVEPTQAGNGGWATISVTGGGLVVDGTTISLRKSGETDIIGQKLDYTANGVLSAYFDLNGVSTGTWDVVVKKGGVEQIMPSAFKVVQAEMPAPWVSTSGRGQILHNMWQTYTINYGNNGNVDALGVPLTIAITNYPETDVELIDFRIEANNYIKTNFPEIVSARTEFFFIYEDYFEPGLDARIYSIIVPIIKAKSSQSVHIRIKSPESFNLETYMNAPFYQTDQNATKSASTINDDWPDQKTKLNACVALAAMDAASSVAAELVGMVLPIGAAYDVFNYAVAPWDAVSPKPDKPTTFWDKVYGFSSVALSVGLSVTGANAVIKGALIAKAMYDGYQKNKECHDLFDPITKTRKGIGAVDSFDPNEMIGPSGYGDVNWTQKNSVIPYTVLFENKSTATAPAHLVTITDTLDLSKFDLKEFGFGSFGFGDTILVPNGNKLKQFSMDVDLISKMNLITRVSGKLDTISGVITWEFISLNPTEMMLEEDPLVGFLPPNNANHVGEGFVSFSVGLKKELGTNDVLKNMASIVFDANKPILTNEYVNTLDLDKPESKVYALDPTIDSHFPVSWTGSDNGSGIASYSVYVMENDTSLQLWRQNTTLISDEFIGNVGSSYKFYSIATDNVSLIESTPGEYDASTQITVHVDEFEMKKTELQVFPNPVKDKLTVSFADAPCGVYVVELVGITGNVYYSKLHDDSEISNGVKLNVDGLSSGQYLLRIIYGNRQETRKVMIK